MMQGVTLYGRQIEPPVVAPPMVAKAAEPLRDRQSRLIDLHPVIRDYVYHPARSVTAATQIDAPLIVVENWFEELKARLGN